MEGKSTFYTFFSSPRLLDSGPPWASYAGEEGNAVLLCQLNKKLMSLEEISHRQQPAIFQSILDTRQQWSVMGGVNDAAQLCILSYLHRKHENRLGPCCTEYTLYSAFHKNRLLNCKFHASWICWEPSGRDPDGCKLTRAYLEENATVILSLQESYCRN